MENLTEYKIKTRRNDHFRLAEKWENCLPKRWEKSLPNKWEKSLTFTKAGGKKHEHYHFDVPDGGDNTPGAVWRHVSKIRGEDTYNQKKHR